MMSVQLYFHLKSITSHLTCQVKSSSCTDREFYLLWGCFSSDLGFPSRFGPLLLVVQGWSSCSGPLVIAADGFIHWLKASHTLGRLVCVCTFHALGMRMGRCTCYVTTIFIPICALFVWNHTATGERVHLCTSTADEASGKEKSRSELWVWIKARCKGCHSALGATTLRTPSSHTHTHTDTLSLTVSLSASVLVSPAGLTDGSRHSPRSLALYLLSLFWASLSCLLMPQLCLPLRTHKPNHPIQPFYIYM